METRRLKTEMMELWKETFHDSDEYINLVFDSYFDTEFVEYHLHDGRVVASLLGVPYTFTAKAEKGAGEAVLRGLYLCGLATKPEWRRRGIMTELIEKINRKADKLGYDFTFLIPASDDLAAYYFRKGYVSAFRRVPNRYSSAHNFFFDNVLLKEEDIEEDKFYNNPDDNAKYRVGKIDITADEKVGDIKRCILLSLENKSGFKLIYSEKYLDVILKENSISGGDVYAVECENGNGEFVSSVAIISFDKNGDIVLPHLFYNDNFSRLLILQFIKQKYKEFQIIEYLYPDDEHRTLITSDIKINFKTSENEREITWNDDDVFEAASHPENYGMARLLRASEILKFAADQSCDSKYSILVKGLFSDDMSIFRTEKGRFEYLRVIGEEDQYYVAIPVYGNISDQKIDDSNCIEEDVVEKRSGKSCFLSIKDTQCGLSETECIRVAKKDVTRLEMQELSEIVWRNKRSDDVVGDVFGIPRIPINMQYLLD